jgi:addiction module RelE/StbE family toxin
MRLAWDGRALDDLEAIANYIARDNPRAAARVVTYIREAATRLQALPRLGPETPEPGVREFVLTRYPYILVYEPADGEIRILAVFHHRQKRG